jgi:hypothetical protein
MNKALFLAAAIAAACSSHAGVVEIQWDSQGRFNHRAEVPAGKMVEICGAIAPGSDVRWQFEASAPLDFNIHYHRGEVVVYPVKLAQRSQAKGRLRVQAREDHCWMWRHKGSAPAALTVQLSR